MNNPLAFPFESAPEAHTRRVYRRLGLLNGLLIGLALALGAWGVETIRTLGLPYPLALPTLWLSSLALLVLCAVAGWLTSRLAKTWLSTVLWFMTGIVVALIIGYQPYNGRTWMVWLADPRFRGLDIFPYTLGGTIAGLILGGLLIQLVLTVLGIVQHYRLEGMVRELGSHEQLNRRVWFQLLWPLPLVALTTLVTASSMDNPAAEAASIIHEVIEVGRTFEGDQADLFQLGLEQGVSYGAIGGVRDQLTETYTLGVGAVNPETSTVVVVAHFDNGAWINCRVIAGQANFCEDASRPYTTGLVELIQGVPAAEDCRNCQPEASEQWQSWLRDRAVALGERPQVTRLAQWGSEVLMRVESATGDAAIECWFTGLQPVQLRSCEEVAGDP
jgi:hypothetical protein